MMQQTEPITDQPTQVTVYCSSASETVDRSANRVETKCVPSMNQETTDLVPRIAAGDEAAFARFYDVTAPVMYGLVRRIVGDPMMAEDIVSESYFQIWQQASRFSAERGSPLTWALTIARSRAIDAMRRCREAVIENLESKQEQVGEAVDDTLDLVAEVEQNTTVREALSALSENQRRMVSLAFFSGFSHSEIAEKTGVPLGTVKSTLREGMIVLRKKLVDPCGGGRRLS